MSLQPRPYPTPVIARASEWLGLMAQPTRLALLDRLDLREEVHVQALVDELQTTQQNVSRHLRLLLVAGIVAQRREGRLAYYRVADEAAIEPARVAIRAAHDAVSGASQHAARSDGGA